MLQAKLFVLDREIPLIQTDMRYSRSIDPGRGVPSKVIGGKIKLTFQTLEDSHSLMHWITRVNGGNGMSEKSKMEEGKVCFYDHGFDDAPTKTYEFNDAYLVYYREYFNSSSDYPMLTTMVISPAIQNYGAENILDWNISHLAPAAEMPHQPMEVVKEHPKIYDLYFEDMDGKRIKELQVGMDVHLVIASENVTGKAVNINLSDKDLDFIYKDELLEDDILKDITISGDIHKEKLKVVADHRDDNEGDEDEGEGNSGSTGMTNSGTQPDPNKELTEYFLTDENGKKVEEYEVGDTIILNIVTKNRIGDKLTIHLEDKTHDFKYNGEVLKDDKLTDFTVTKDEEKIELEVIVQTAKSE